AMRPDGMGAPIAIGGGNGSGAAPHAGEGGDGGAYGNGNGNGIASADGADMSALLNSVQQLLTQLQRMQGRI
ncbi:MAG TPA: hypothetical protein VK570_19680, partial [Rubrivivax sp.]|nr:hypothetical protein [Rubrivivax sp.]